MSLLDRGLVAMVGGKGLRRWGWFARLVGGIVFEGWPRCSSGLGRPWFLGCRCPGTIVGFVVAVVRVRVCR
jgi:hypothetical protein